MDIFDKCLSSTAGYFSEFRARDDQYFVAPKLEGTVGPRMKYNGDEVIVWSINSYLGMHQNKKYIAAANNAVKEYGAHSPMGSRLMSGNTDIHNQLEKELAQFVGKEEANLFANGYLGIIGIITALVGPDDMVIADRQCHACLIDGMRLAASPGNYRIYKHNDVNDLEKVLSSVRKKHKGGILILTEGVFGMSGEIPDLKSICELKNKYEARLLVDDAHGFGVIGKNGKGVGEHHDVMEEIDIYFSTFAKSFAGIGCFSASSEIVNRYIKYNARANIFTKSLPLIYANTAYAVLKEIQSNGSPLLEKLHSNANKLQKGLKFLGYDLGRANSQVTPIYLESDLELCTKMVKTLREQFQVFVSAVVYPVVPQNTILLRLVPTSLHKNEDIEITLNAFDELKKIYKI